MKKSVVSMSKWIGMLCLFVCLLVMPFYVKADATYQELPLNTEWDKTGTFTDTYEYRYYELNVPVAGYLTMDVNSFTSGLLAHLCDENYQIIADITDTCLWDSSEATPILASRSYWVEAGTYYIRVYSYGGNNGSFWVKASFRAANNQETEPNQTYAQPTTLYMDKEVRGLISLQDVVDYYVFTLATPQTVTVQFKAYYSGPRIRLRNSNLEEIVGGVLWEGSETSPVIRKDEVELEAGTYYIHIDKYGSDCGYYDLQLIRGKVTATNISMNKTAMSLKVGETGQLAATVLPADTDDKTVVWTSSDASVAEVNSYGVITALKAGNVIVKATTQDGSNISASCVVTVTEPEKTLRVSTTKATLYKGKSITVSAIATPTAGISYSSSDNTIAAVTSDGTIIAKKKGTCQVYVEANGITEIIKVTVKNPVLKVNKTKVTLKVKKSYQLKVTKIAPTSKVTYKSSNKKIAKVSKTGKITARKVGTCKIYVSANGVKKTVKVTVKKR